MRFLWIVHDKKLKCAKCSIISTNNGDKDGIFKELNKPYKKKKNSPISSYGPSLGSSYASAYASPYKPVSESFKPSSSGYGNAMYFLAISRGFK
jgi:hypothetical protein